VRNTGDAFDIWLTNGKRLQLKLPTALEFWHRLQKYRQGRSRIKRWEDPVMREPPSVPPEHGDSPPPRPSAGSC
jgi:hypothetical protein